MQIFENKFIVRDFQKRDYQQVINVWFETALTRPERGDNLEVIEKTLALGGKLFILEDIEKHLVIGTSWITNDGRRLHLQYFAILPEYQAKGLAHYLMIESLKYAKNLGMQIKLEVHKDNFIAKKLYEKWNFKLLGPYQIFILRDLSELNF